MSIPTSQTPISVPSPAVRRPKRGVPEGLWLRCPGCQQMIFRKQAERALGEKFDVRAFHDAVLGQGGVTLPVLERQVDVYIARAQGP